MSTELAYVSRLFSLGGMSECGKRVFPKGVMKELDDGS